MSFCATPPRVLIADSNAERREQLRQHLPLSTIVLQPPTREALLIRMENFKPAVLVLGKLGDSGLEAAIRVTALLQASHPDTKVVLLADNSSEDAAICALRAGAREYFKPPFSSKEVADTVLRFLSSTIQPCEPLEMVGNSVQLHRVRGLIQRVAPTDGTILITGETGTGKELVARGIHKLSLRSARPLICFNCSAVPDTLLESELFGYEKGAFTGAATRQAGLMTQAHGGSLFLDEIGEMSSRAQAKILRAIETGEVQPLGASRSHQVDIRVIAATHRDLGELVSQNEFRQDLFFRLNVIPIDLAPLRKRRDDIPELVRHFISEYNVQYQRSIEGVTPAALRLLCDEDWPGNIRQLRNVLQAGFLICDGRWITEGDLRELHWDFARGGTVESVLSSPSFSHSSILPEPDRLLGALQATSWNKSKAAELLHWSRMTVYRKIAKYNLEPRSVDDTEFRTAQAS